MHKHHSLIYIRHTSFTSVLILSEIINFRGEINILSFRVAVLTSSLFNSLTNKHSRVHRGLRCLFHLISCFTLSFVLLSVFCFVFWSCCFVMNEKSTPLKGKKVNSPPWYWCSVQQNIHVTAENSCVSYVG